MSREFRELEGAIAPLTFISASKLAKEDFKGVVLEAEYVGEVPNNFNEAKPDFKFMKEDGSHVIVNSCGSITKQMEKVKPGDFIQISYKGQKKIDKGPLKGKMIHDFHIMIAD